MTVPDYYNCHFWFPHNHDLYFKSPYRLLYISDNFSSENLEANQTNILWLIFFFLLIAFLLDTVLKMEGEIIIDWLLLRELRQFRK